MSVAVVIPAHNEGATIGAVIAAVSGAPGIEQLIVVADSCTDDTAAVAQGAGAEVRLIDASDKGTALAAGLERVTSELVLFLDADVEGLRPGHVEALSIAPPLDGMVVGLRDGAIASGLPPISGERRLPAAFARSVGLAGTGYRAELALDAAAGRAGLAHRHYEMVGVTNPSREYRHPLMYGDLALYALLNAPALARYTLGTASSR